MRGRITGNATIVKGKAKLEDNNLPLIALGALVILGAFLFVRNRK